VACTGERHGKQAQFIIADNFALIEDITVFPGGTAHHLVRPEQ
jgi:hypothetical protein